MSVVTDKLESIQAKDTTGRKSLAYEECVEEQFKARLRGVMRAGRAGSALFCRQQNKDE